MLLPVRVQWDDFPPILQHTSCTALRADPDFAAARLGDLTAARKVVARHYRRNLFRVKVSHVAAVISQSADGSWNALPLAVAEQVARESSAKIVPTIVQANCRYPANVSAVEALLNQPVFTGSVVPGRYAITHDIVNFGSSIANLRGFLISHGCQVAAATALGTAIFASQLTPNKEILVHLNRRFKNESQYFTDATGIERFEFLTNREAYVLNGLQHLGSLGDPRFAANRDPRPQA